METSTQSNPVKPGRFHDMRTHVCGITMIPADQEDVKQEGSIIYGPIPEPQSPQ